MNTTSSPRIYIDKLGYRNPITDAKTIIWFFKQQEKIIRKREQTVLYLNILENKKYLLEVQAFELLAFIESRISKKQKENRENWKAKKEIQNHLFLQEMKDWQNDYNLKKKLFSNIGLN